MGTTDTFDSVQHSRDRLEALVTPNQPVYTLTTYGRGARDYVRVFVTADLGSGVEIQEITYHVANLIDRKNTDAGIGYGGGGYSKGLEAFIDTCRGAGIEADQKNWRAL